MLLGRKQTHAERVLALRSGHLCVEGQQWLWVGHAAPAGHMGRDTLVICHLGSLSLWEGTCVDGRLPAAQPLLQIPSDPDPGQTRGQQHAYVSDSFIYMK